MSSISPMTGILLNPFNNLPAIPVLASIAKIAVNWFSNSFVISAWADSDSPSLTIILLVVLYIPTNSSLSSFNFTLFSPLLCDICLVFSWILLNKLLCPSIISLEIFSWFCCNNLFFRISLVTSLDDNSPLSKFSWFDISLLCKPFKAVYIPFKPIWVLPCSLAFLILSCNPLPKSWTFLFISVYKSSWPSKAISIAFNCFKCSLFNSIAFLNSSFDLKRIFNCFSNWSFSICSARVRASICSGLGVFVFSAIV